MNIRLEIYGCLIAIAIVITGCKKVQYEPDPSDIPSGAPLVTVIYDPGALGDRSYNDLIYAGVERAALTRGLRTLQLSPSSASEGLAALDTYFEQMRMLTDTVRRLLIVTGAEYDEYIREHSKELDGNSLADLLYLETKEPLPGKGSTLCLPYYGAMYEAGAVSRIYSGTTLLIAANSELQVIQESVKGFTDGFNVNYSESEENPELLLEWLSDETVGGFRIDDGSAMDIVYGGGSMPVANLVFPICGGASGTFYQLSNLFGGYEYVGIDVTSVSPHCPFSVVKHIDRALDLCIGEWLSAEGMPKHQTLGYADGWTEFVLHPYTDMQKFFTEKVLSAEMLRTIHEDALKKEAGDE